MLNYYFVQFQEKDNKDIHGYKLLLDDEELEILLYDYGFSDTFEIGF